MVVRPLAAILAADVAGYSRLMGADEEGTLNRLAALAQLGRTGEAREEAQNYLGHHPEFTITRWVAQFPFRDPAPRDHIIEGLRKAGLPE